MPKDLVYQSGSKPKLVAKFLVTNFGVFFCSIYNILKKYAQYHESDNNVIKYYGSLVPHDRDISFN